MFCPKCGTQIADDGKFCPACGNPIGAAQAPVPPMQPQFSTMQQDPVPPMQPQVAPVQAPVGTSIVVKNLENNANIKMTDQKGCFQILEYQKDMSVDPNSAVLAYFMSEMNFRKKQVLCKLNGNAVKVQAGAMQWTAGNVSMNSGIKGAKDFLGKALKGAVTNESAAKPIFQGYGQLMLEPTYKYIFLEDLSSWGSGMVLDDGLFLACDGHIQEEIVRRQNASSALLGGEGLFNLSLSGNGIAVLESAVPRDELIEFNLVNDEVRIDGNMAVAWSKSLQFTVEKSTKSLLGSLASGEGLVNVYRGTGKILMSPVAFGTHMAQNNSHSEPGKSSSGGLLGSVVSSVLDL